MRLKLMYLALSLLLLNSCAKKTSYFNSELSQIESFIKKENIKDIISDANNGYFYKVLTNDSDNKLTPGKSSYISVTYSIKDLDGSIAKAETDKELYLYDAPKSWQIIMPKITEKSKFIIISTSDISYSKEITEGLVDTQKPLYFSIELKSIK